MRAPEAGDRAARTRRVFIANQLDEAPIKLLVIARAARRGNPGGLLDCHGPAGFALTAVLFELPFVDPLSMIFVISGQLPEYRKRTPVAKARRRRSVLRLPPFRSLAIEKIDGDPTKYSVCLAFCATSGCLFFWETVDECSMLCCHEYF
jgi:hypothetical protein